MSVHVAYDDCLDLGLAASVEQRPAVALSHFAQASTLAPASGVPHLLMGAEHACRGDLALAEDAYQAALRLAPDLHLARYQLGLLQFGAQRTAAALATWQPLFALCASQPLGHFARGFAALVEDDQAAALRHFRRGLALSRDEVPRRWAWAPWSRPSSTISAMPRCRPGCPAIPARAAPGSNEPVRRGIRVPGGSFIRHAGLRSTCRVPAHASSAHGGPARGDGGAPGCDGAALATRPMEHCMQHEGKRGMQVPALIATLWLAACGGGGGGGEPVATAPVAPAPVATAPAPVATAPAAAGPAAAAAPTPAPPPTLAPLSQY